MDAVFLNGTVFQGGYIAEIQQAVCQNNCCPDHLLRMGFRERLRGPAGANGFRARALRRPFVNNRAPISCGVAYASVQPLLAS